MREEGKQSFLEGVTIDEFDYQPDAVYKMNLIAYMLGKMVFHKDTLVEFMLQRMLDSLFVDPTMTMLNKEDEEEAMLVFRDLHGQVWQISKVDDLSNFDEVLDEAECEINFFRPGDKPLTEQFEEAAATLRREVDGEKTYRLDSVRHAAEPKGGIANGLSSAVNHDLHSFEEEDDDYSSSDD